jgi:large subunit ribosomal protein L12
VQRLFTYQSQTKNTVKMEYVYGALLLHSAGQKVDEAAIKKVMEASGAKVDDAKVKALVASLDGVDIEEAISKAAPVAAAAAPAAAAPAAGGEAAPAAEEKPSEEDKAKSEEEAAEGLGALFG